jgi:hypothetical protein
MGVGKRVDFNVPSFIPQNQAASKLMGMITRAEKQCNKTTRDQRPFSADSWLQNVINGLVICLKYCIVCGVKHVYSF